MRGTFSLPPLCPIVNAGSCADPLALFEQLLAANCRYIQLRAKTAARRDFLALARRCAEATAIHNRSASGQTFFIVNDRVDIAALSGAAGVHLGQDDIPPGDARLLLGSGAIIGYSTHSPDQLARAPLAEIDYAGFGPVFETATKPGANPTTGLEMLARAAASAQIPLVAIGGITAANAAQVFAAGAHSAAVIRDLESAPDVRAYVRIYEELRGKIK